jgi:hypothetical protein
MEKKGKKNGETEAEEEEEAEEQANGGWTIASSQKQELKIRAFCRPF